MRCAERGSGAGSGARAGNAVGPAVVVVVFVVEKQSLGRAWWSVVKGAVAVAVAVDGDEEADDDDFQEVQPLVVVFAAVQVDFAEQRKPLVATSTSALSCSASSVLSCAHAAA